jgi:hypothetical protein
MQSPPACDTIRPRREGKAMELGDGIRTIGFRKWYERELLQSHAHMTLAFLSAIGVFAAVEAFGHVQSAWDRAFDAAAIVLCAGVGIRSIRRYLYLLNHAEQVANQADCPHCKAYARFTLVDAHGAQLRVQCRTCAHRWTIDDALADGARSEQ